MRFFLAVVTACAGVAPAPAEPEPEPEPEPVVAAPLRPAALDRACPPDLDGARGFVAAGGGPCVVVAASVADPGCVDGPKHVHGHDDRLALTRTCDGVAETVAWAEGQPARVRVERAAPAQRVTMDPRGTMVAIRRADGILTLVRWSDLDAVRVIGAPLGASDWNGVLATEVWAPEGAWTAQSIDAMVEVAATTPGDDRVRYRALWDAKDPKRPRLMTVQRPN
jgi:hypothetical protein